MKKYWLRSLYTGALASLVLASSSFPASAADTLTIGAGGYYANRPYTKYNNHGSAIPYIVYDSDRFYIDEDTAGVYLVKNNTHELDVGLHLTDFEFQNKSASGVMKKLRNRKITLMSALNYQYKTNVGNFFASVEADVLGRNKGFTGDASYEAPFQMGRFGLAFRGGAQWNSSKYNKYYFGISKNESEITGLSTYNPGSSVTPYISASAMYSITRNWGIFLYGRYDKMSSEAKDSPMVSRSGNLVIESGIAYTF